MDQYHISHNVEAFFRSITGSDTEDYNKLVIFMKKYIDRKLDGQITCLGGDGHNEKLLLVRFLYKLNPDGVAKLHTKTLKKTFNFKNTHKLIENDTLKYVIIKNTDYNLDNIDGLLKSMVGGDNFCYLDKKDPKYVKCNFKVILPLATNNFSDKHKSLRMRSNVIKINTSKMDINDLRNIVNELLKHKNEVSKIINSLVTY